MTNLTGVSTGNAWASHVLWALCSDIFDSAEGDSVGCAVWIGQDQHVSDMVMISLTSFLTSFLTQALRLVLCDYLFREKNNLSCKYRKRMSTHLRNATRGGVSDIYIIWPLQSGSACL
jgi:hypothetical protein